MSKADDRVKFIKGTAAEILKGLEVPDEGWEKMGIPKALADAMLGPQRDFLRGIMTSNPPPELKKLLEEL